MAKNRSRGNGQGTVFKRRGPSWYISWYDAGGVRREKCTRTTDKTTAQRMLAEIIRGVMLRREGIIDAKAEAVSLAAAKAIDSHIDDFRATMEARGRSWKHVNGTIGAIRAVCTAAGFASPAEIDQHGVDRATALMRDDGRAARTIQSHITAMKAFCKWLVANGRLAADPIASMVAPSAKRDRRRLRRMLLPDEWPWLRSATLANGDNGGMVPAERALLYAVAIQTGLRSNELRQLTRVDLFLTVGRPFIRCQAQHTKNGIEARQYIQADLAEQLRILTATMAPNASVFRLPNEHDMAEMLRRDLAAARKMWLADVRHDPEEAERRRASDFLEAINHDGEALDFHALRHTCGSWLALQGAHINLIRNVMRHSTITLTADTYAHLLPEQHADEISRMPTMLFDHLEATGTGTAVGTAVDWRNDAKPCEALREFSDFEYAEKDDGNCMKIRVAEVSTDEIQGGKENTPEGIRTPDRRIRNPLEIAPNSIPTAVESAGTAVGTAVDSENQLPPHLLRFISRMTAAELHTLQQFINATQSERQGG